MAGYIWLSSFFLHFYGPQLCLSPHIKSAKKEQGYYSHLDWTRLVNKGFIIFAKIFALGKVHLVWQGWGWRYWNSKLEILAAPSLAVHFFRSLPPPFGFKVYKFSEPPFRVSKNFRCPPSMFSSLPPCHIKWTFSLIKRVTCFLRELGKRANCICSTTNSWELMFLLLWFKYLLLLFAFPSPKLSKNYQVSFNSNFFMPRINAGYSEWARSAQEVWTQDLLHLAHTVLRVM